MANGASITIFNTGVDASGAALSGGTSDPHWATGVVLSSGSLYPTWAPDTSTSAWIGKTDSVHPGAAPYTFTETFSLAGLDPSSAVLSGTWFIDDTGTLALNGHVIASGSEILSGQSFNINGASGFFLPDANTLSVTITSSDNNYDGARVIVSGTANSASTTPEPTTTILITLGLLAITFLKLRQYSLSK